MYLTDTFHPPAGIDPLLVVSQNLAWTFLIAPVALGAMPAHAVRLGLASWAAPPPMAAALACSYGLALSPAPGGGRRNDHPSRTSTALR